MPKRTILRWTFWTDAEGLVLSNEFFLCRRRFRREASDATWVVRTCGPFCLGFRQRRVGGRSAFTPTPRQADVFSTN